ncbi:MAG: acyltransferase [Deltaproteobacteria bacterium]|nr:acyltransferase [Deltaproteobacteria bacterium]
MARPANRILWLDLLRGAAIVMVLLFHFTVRYPEKYPGNAFAGEPLFSFGFGWTGVHLFFMISGFIIYHTIQNKKGPLDFLTARLSRLMPPYWVAIAVIIALEYAHSAVFNQPNRNALTDTAFNLAMVPDIFHKRYLDGAFWSLYVEVKFYVLFALLWGVIDMRKRLYFYATFLAIFALAAVHFFLFKFPMGHNFYYFLIFWAGIGAYKVMKEDLSIWEFLFIIILTTAGTIGIYKDGNELIIGIPAFSLLFLVAERAERAYPSLFRILSPCAFLGRISYSSYLLHQPVGYVVLGALATTALGVNAALVVAVAAVLLTALLGFTFVEKLDRPIAKKIMARIGRFERLYRPV